jgi:hypothetical protein
MEDLAPVVPVPELVEALEVVLVYWKRRKVGLDQDCSTWNPRTSDIPHPSQQSILEQNWLQFLKLFDHVTLEIDVLRC